MEMTRDSVEYHARRSDHRRDRTRVPVGGGEGEHGHEHSHGHCGSAAGAAGIRHHDAQRHPLGVDQAVVGPLDAVDAPVDDPDHLGFHGPHRLGHGGQLGRGESQDRAIFDPTSQSLGGHRAGSVRHRRARGARHHERVLHGRDPHHVHRGARPSEGPRGQVRHVPRGCPCHRCPHQLRGLLPRSAVLRDQGRRGAPE